MIKRPLLWLFYRNRIVCIIRNKFLSGLLLGVSALYFPSFEIFRDDLPFFVRYPHASVSVFFILAILCFVVVVFRGIADYVEENIYKGREGFNSDLIALTSKLVRAKLERFKTESEGLSSSGNTFKKITKPDVQISLLMGELIKILQERFLLNEDQVCITIMKIENSGEELSRGFFKFKTYRNWKHTTARKLLSENSAVKRCLDTGQVIFYPDKEKAAKKDLYFLSKRDSEHKSGSIFCYPSITKMPMCTSTYVISITTYGKKLCSYGDIEETEAIKVIFTEICRRIDVELTLESIKDWQG